MYLAECAYSNKYPNYSDSIPTGVMERTVQFFKWQETQILAFWKTVIGGKAQGEQAEQKLGLYILAHGSEVLTNRDIEGAIRWAQADEFWQANILSPTKLRAKFDQLRLQAQRKKAPRGRDAAWDDFAAYVPQGVFK